MLRNSMVHKTNVFFPHHSPKTLIANKMLEKHKLDMKPYICILPLCDRVITKIDKKHMRGARGV